MARPPLVFSVLGLFLSPVSVSAKFARPVPGTWGPVAVTARAGISFGLGAGRGTEVPTVAQVLALAAVSPSCFQLPGPPQTLLHASSCPVSTCCHHPARHALAGVVGRVVVREGHLEVHALAGLDLGCENTRGGA